MIQDILQATPHPSWTELIISTEVFIALYLPKRIIDALVQKEEKVVKQHLTTLRKRHVKYHSGRFHKCTHCTARVDLPMQQLVSAEVGQQEASQ